MGSSASKPVRAAAGAAKRQYPKQAAPPPRMTTTPPKATKAPEAPTPQPTPPPSQPPHPAPGGPVYHTQEQPSSTKSSAIDLDGRDPDFAASLRSIGPVTPNPTFSNSSTFSRTQNMQTVFPTASNPALLTVSARQRMTQAGQEEMDRLARGEHTERQFLDALTIQQVLNMRDLQRMPPREIERSLRLKDGVVGRLGGEGLVARAG